MVRLIKCSPLLVLMAMVSCRAPKEIHHEKLEKVKDELLMEKLDSMSSQKIEHFFSKVSTSYKDSSQSNSFKTSLRLRSDSALNATISFANIPVINALLTTDSIYITDKRNKCYIIQSLDYLKENFGVTFSFRNVEELVLGLPVGYNPEHKYDQIETDGMYQLCSHKKREIKRNEKKDEKEIITYYGLSPDLKFLQQVIIDSPQDTTIITIDFLKRELVGTIFAPEDVEVTISTPRKLIKLELGYRKTRVDEAETIYFVIPEEYEECE